LGIDYINTQGGIIMGYRSEVAFIVPESAPKFEDVENCFETIKESDGYRLYHGTWLKWYEDYPAPQAVASYLADLEPEEYLFIRLGEDSNDIEEEGEFWDNPFGLGWVRQIEFE
jgi:hypothetical protein